MPLPPPPPLSKDVVNVETPRTPRTKGPQKIMSFLPSLVRGVRGDQLFKMLQTLCQNEDSVGVFGTEARTFVFNQGEEILKGETDIEQTEIQARSMSEVCSDLFEWKYKVENMEYERSMGSYYSEL